MEFIPKNFYRVFENFDHEISLLLILINLQGLQDLTLFPNSIKKPTKHVPINTWHITLFLEIQLVLQTKETNCIARNKEFERNNSQESEFKI